MVKTKKFAKYDCDTKITTIRIPDLNDLDKEKSLRQEIDDFVVELLFGNLNSKTNTNEIDTEILKKMIPEFAKANLEVDLKDNEINRIKDLYEGL